MKNIITFIFLTLSILSATIINVPLEFSTIQSGIDAAEEGDTVLISQGSYYENVILEKEILLTSEILYDDLGIGWVDNQNINETIISGVPNPSDPRKGSCLVIRGDNISPTVQGLTFTNGIGTSILETFCGVQHQKRVGGAIIIHNAFPTINFNRFINNGSSNQDGNDGSDYAVVEGGAIGSYNSEEVEFDEDRNYSDVNNGMSRTERDELNFQNNYFENNSSGDGMNIYSNGFSGSIDVSNSVFGYIDCENNSVNEYVLKTKNDQAVYIQNNIIGDCITGNSFYVSPDGENSNLGTEDSPFLTIGHTLSMLKNDSTTTTIYLKDGVFSPSTNGEQFPILIPDNIHLIGNGPENTVIDADADNIKQTRVLVIEKSENVIISNLTVTGGNHTTGGCWGGGGILVGAESFNYNYNNLIIDNVVIKENHSTKGGGIFIANSMEGSNLQIKNTLVTNNSIGLGADGIPWQPAGSGIAFWECRGGNYLDKVLVRDNISFHAEGSVEVGAISNQNSKVVINKTTICQNIGSNGYFGYGFDYPDLGLFSGDSIVFYNSLVHDNEFTDIKLSEGPNQAILSHTAYSSLDYNSESTVILENSFLVSDPSLMTESDGYTLLPNSFLIDAGLSDLDGDGSEDISDYFGTAPDIGYDEYEVLNVDEQSQMPKTFSLSQNFPNPFNPTTKIKYILPGDRFVKITIHDLNGRNIKTLINGIQNGGSHILEWDSRNDMGEAVSAGMYLYTLQAGENRQTRKMILLK